MPRYLISFDAHAMEHIPAEDIRTKWPQRCSRRIELLARLGQGKPSRHAGLS
jgi:hypothetical protein